MFVLNASLPYHMLAACAESLPRPTWELELYVVVCLIMRSASPCFCFYWFGILYVRSTPTLSSVHSNSCMFLLVLTTAYLEAQSIWEPFKKRVSLDSNSSLETGRPFNLREIVQIPSDSKYVLIIFSPPASFHSHLNYPTAKVQRLAVQIPLLLRISFCPVCNIKPNWAPTVFHWCINGG